MEIDEYGIDCCAITELSGFPTDVLNSNTWEDEHFEREWQWFLDDIKQVKGAAIATVNKNQLKAKKELEKRRFKVIGTLQSKEGNGTIWIMGRGIKTPRTKRGRHAKHR